MSTNSKRACITGVYGQDGSYLAELLLRNGYYVLGIATPGDEQSAMLHLFAAHPHFNVAYVDLQNTEAIRAALHTHGVDELYNLAAISDLGTARAQPELTYAINFQAFHALAYEAFSLNARIRIFHALSSRILVPDSKGVISETSAIKEPANAYDTAKRDSLLKTIIPLRASGCFIVGGFLCNHESPRRDERFVTARIVRTIARIEQGKETTLQIGNVEAKRDWSHAEDVVSAMHAALHIDTPNDYVIGSGELHSVQEFVSVAFQKAGMELTWSGSGIETVAHDKNGVLRVTTNPEFYQKDDNPVVSDTARIENATQWKRAYTFEGLIASMLQGARDAMRSEG